MKDGWLKRGLLALVVMMLALGTTMAAGAEDKQKLDEPVIYSFDKRLEIGVISSLSIDSDYKAASIDVEIYRQESDGWSYVRGTSYDSWYAYFELDTTEYGTGTYRMDITCYPYDSDLYDASKNSQEFEIYGELASGPKMELPKEANIKDWFEAIVYCENVSEIEIRRFSGTSFEESNGGSSWTAYPTSSNSYSFSEYTGGEAATYSFQARAFVDDYKWTDWGEVSTIQILSEGKLDTPKLKNVPATLQKGYVLEFEIEPVPNADFYFVQAGSMMRTVSATDAEVKVRFDDSDEIFTEDFEITCYAYSTGRYEDSEDSIAYPVEVTGELEAAPAFTLDKAEYYLGDAIIITPAADVDKLYIKYGDEDSGYLNYYFEKKQKYIVFANYEGEKEIIIQAFIKDHWTDSSADPVTISVKSNGELIAPDTLQINNHTIYQNTTETIEEIDYKELGDNLVVTIPSIDNAERYEIDLYGGTYVSKVTNVAGNIDLGHMSFDNGIYYLSLIISANGYNEVYVDYVFRITGERSPAPNVSVSASEVKPYEPVTFHVSAENATLIQMKNGDTFKAQNGEAVITLVPDYNGAVYSFSAYQNGHWSEWSDEIQVRITADGYTTPTDLHLPLAAPTYTTPTDLKVVTTTSGLTMDVNAVEHAENGAIRVVRREDGLTTWTKKLTQMSKAQQVAIPATAFAQPGRYAMYIEVYDTDSFTYNDTLWVITVTGDPTPTPALPKIFLGEKTVAQFGEPLSFEVQASGTISNGFAVFDINGYGYDVPIRSVWVEEEETGKAKTMIRFNNTRLIGRELYVSFKYQIDGVWTEFSEPYLFVIQPEAGEISNPRPELEKNKAAIGEKITVNFQTDERVDHYEVWAWSSAYAAKWYEGGFKTFEVEEPGKASIDTSKLDVGTWYIRVYAYPKAGYINIEDSDVYDILYLTKPSTVALTTLTLPSALTTIEEQAFYGTIAEKVVIPGKCQSIGSQAFAFAPNLTVAVIPASVTSIAEDAFLGCGGLTIQTTGTNTAAYKFATAHGFAVTVGN